NRHRRPPPRRTEPRRHGRPGVSIQYPCRLRFRPAHALRRAGPKYDRGRAARAGQEKEEMTSPPGHALKIPRRRLASAALLAGAAVACSALFACTPTVQVAAPDKPITINLNIKLDAEVKLRVERKAQE